MATAMYLEHYLDSLESLPGELQRNFSLMKDLDQKAQDLMKEIDDKAEGYLSSVRNMSPEKRSDFLSAIQKLFSKSREFGDDKVQLAMQTYEMVDKHIRKLDADLARFEADLRDKTLYKPNAEEKQESGKKSNIKEKDKKKRKSMKEEFEDEIPKKKKKKGQGQQNEPAHPPMISPLLSLTMNNPSDVLDMPVDPNEPTYCLCHQVSYGEMIGCDNLDRELLDMLKGDKIQNGLDIWETSALTAVGRELFIRGPFKRGRTCPIEWFHFGCVGLTAKPKGKWYCPRCTEERKKK